MVDAPAPGRSAGSRSVSKLHSHYQQWFVGNGAQTEFRLDYRFRRPDDVAVFVNGNKMRPDIPGTAHDYKLRGITPGYSGDQNAILLASAPIVGMDVCVSIISE